MRRRRGGLTGPNGLFIAQRTFQSSFLARPPHSVLHWENSWLWTADHDLDGTNPTTIAVGRGMLVSAPQGTWLLGTSAEHNDPYAYRLSNAANVFASCSRSRRPTGSLYLSRPRPRRQTKLAIIQRSRVQSSKAKLATCPGISELSAHKHTLYYYTAPPSGHSSQRTI
jgi:hypothetical protein